uniref:Uncharacterized protein n=1 Tax=Anguilla anguilla TaxID=7936 RepID=A0A0E9RQP3_ANGAN
MNVSQLAQIIHSFVWYIVILQTHWTLKPYSMSALLSM